MAAECIAGAGDCFVARRDPRATLDEVVPAVERWHRKVVVERMHLEALKGHDRRASPLPDVANDVAEVALWEGIDRTTGGEVLEVHVAWRVLP